MGYDRENVAKGKEMIKHENWITPDPSFDPDSYNGLQIKIKIPRIGSEAMGTLKLEKRNDNGQIQISASYNANPFPNTSDLRTFSLTQDQLNEFHDKPTSCVSIAPLCEWDSVTV
jgi:DNA polymerase sigma